MYRLSKKIFNYRGESWGLNVIFLRATRARYPRNGIVAYEDNRGQRETGFLERVKVSSRETTIRGKLEISREA